MVEEPMLQAATVVRAHGGVGLEGRGAKISPMTQAITALEWSKVGPLQVCWFTISVGNVVFWS